MEIFSQLGGILVAGYRGIGVTYLSLERHEYTPAEMPTHHCLRPAQGPGELGATLHGASWTARHWTAVKSCRLQSLDPMLGATDSRLALAPITKSRAAPTHDATRMQSEDLSAPATMSADELQEDAT
jgi:hypothetical protein